MLWCGCKRLLLFFTFLSLHFAIADNFTLALPTNSREATEFSKQLRLRFNEAAQKEGIDPQNTKPDSPSMTLLIEYSNPEVVNNVYVQEAITKLVRKGYSVRVERYDASEEALIAIETLNKNAGNIMNKIIGEVYSQKALGTPSEELKLSATQNFIHKLNELKVFFGLRRGTTLFSFVQPFLDNKTGYKKPKSLMWHTFKTQFPLIVATTVSAFYGALFLPHVQAVMGDVNFFDLSYHWTYWTLHSTLTGSGHRLPLDPAYFALGAGLTRLFWAFFDPAADANMRKGSRFNVYTNRSNIPYQYQMLSQFAHSFPGDLFIVVCGYELSRMVTGVTIPYHHLLYTLVPLVSLSGSLAKNLPKSILFQMMDSKIISEKGQNLGNTYIGLVLSYMKTMKVVNSGGPLDPYYWFSYLGILYAVHTSLLNKSEPYRVFFRSFEGTLSMLSLLVHGVTQPTVNKIKSTSAGVKNCLLKLRAR